MHFLTVLTLQVQVQVSASHPPSESSGKESFLVTFILWCPDISRLEAATPNPYLSLHIVASLLSVCVSILSLTKILAEHSGPTPTQDYLISGSRLITSAKALFQ